MATWQTSTFNERLEELGMSPACEGEEWSGLKLVADLENEENPTARFALEDAARYGADAVFFRQFPNNPNRGPLAQMYIYDRTRQLNDSLDDFGEIQRKLWNAEIVPLAAVLTNAEVKLFSCREQPNYIPLEERFHCQWLRKLEITLAAEKMFIRHGIESGLLWEDSKFADSFSITRSSHHTLLEHLRHFKAELLQTNQLTEDTAKRILVMAILLKYLDDRKGSDGKGIFPDGFVAQFADDKDAKLAELFTIPGACIELFDNLSQHFNGGIFTLAAEEKEQLQTADLTAIARFMEGTHEPGGQQVFWPLYSFNDLPVELVSNIYEEFLAKDGENSKGIVYTPPILVELLLTETLPLSPNSLNWRVLDPACGSGIFLVGAFRRLVHCWRMANDWRHPGHKDLQQILRENIFGVEEKSEAVLVTAFSLCIALCDQLDPKVIWEELRFDDLREQNLRAIDFFEFIDDTTTPKDFDLVIGNPPFLSKQTTPAAKRVEKKAAKHRPPVPDKSLALLFLDQAFGMCREAGTVCLVQPAGPLLYNIQAREFRNHLLESYDVQSVLDFTPLESILFEGASIAAAAIIAYKCPPKRDELLHAIFRRTRSSKDRLLLETDCYDLHRLGRDYVKQNPYAWKVNLLGGGRLHRMLGRFAELPTLEEVLENRKQYHGWQFGEGYSVGCGKTPNDYQYPSELERLSEKEVQNQFHLNRTPNRAGHLTGKYGVAPSGISLAGIDKAKVSKLTEIFFEKPRRGNKEIFLPPHVLIRETIIDGHLPAAFSDEELVFSKQIFGVHGPVGQEEELKELSRRLSQSDLYTALLATTSSQYLVRRATSPITADILALPYPTKTELELVDWEKELVRDVVDSLAPFRRQGENAAVLNPASHQDLQDFASTYCRTLNAIYKEFRALEPFPIGKGKDFVCHPFRYGETPEIELPEADQAERFLQELCHRQHGPRLFINRIIRLYEQNIILMIKPNQKRYWLRSVAMRDADETMVDLWRMGY